MTGVDIFCIIMFCVFAFIIGTIMGICKVDVQWRNKCPKHTPELVISRDGVTCYYKCSTCGLEPLRGQFK